MAASTFATAPAWARARQPGVASSNGESNRSRPAQHGSPAQSRRVWLTSSLGLSGSSHSTPMTPMLAVHKPCPSHIRLCCTLPLAGSRIPNASLTLTPLVRSPPAPQREYYSELSSRSLQIPSLSLSSILLSHRPPWAPGTTENVPAPAQGTEIGLSLAPRSRSTR